MKIFLQMSRDGVNPQISFSNIARGNHFRKEAAEFTGDDFPALGGNHGLSKQQREDILMSNLLGNPTSSSINSNISSSFPSGNHATSGIGIKLLTSQTSDIRHRRSR
jgi:hypothetical protein